LRVDVGYLENFFICILKWFAGNWGLIYSLMSKASALEMVLGLVSPNSVSSSSIGTTFPLLVEFRVSKHIIPSKQSSNPSLLSTLAAWALSAFVKIYTKRPCTSS